MHREADALLLTLVSAIEALVVPAKVSNSEQELVALLAQQVESPTSFKILTDEQRLRTGSGDYRTKRSERALSGWSVDWNLASTEEWRRPSSSTACTSCEAGFRMAMLHRGATSGDVGSELERFTRDLIDLEFTSPDSADRI